LPLDVAGDDLALDPGALVAARPAHEAASRCWKMPSAETGAITPGELSIFGL
jgi:hypothetical protein